MKKRALAVVLILFLATAAAPCVTYANAGINKGGVYDLKDFGSGSTITVSTQENVMLTNSTGNTYSDIQIVCASGNTNLMLNNIKISNTSADKCALSFTGRGNSLVLAGTNVLKSGANQPGILVADNNSLTISGGGTLSAQGGDASAGIGSGSNCQGGMICIDSTSVTAAGGAGGITDRGVLYGGGAGIGGGDNARGGTLIVINADITAQGGGGGAGIGGGSGGGGGNICIYSGNVTAEGSKSLLGYGGAGLGGGAGASGGTTAIDNGTIIAKGSLLAAGIGGGAKGSAGMTMIYGGTVTASGYAAPGIGDGYGANYEGSIHISGGMIFADGLGSMDIGFNTSKSTLSVSGDAAVFCKYSGCFAANTATHKLYKYAFPDNGVLFGVSLPNGWKTYPAAYIVPITLTYDANGGIGGRAVTQHTGTHGPVCNGDGFSNGVLIVKGWNTKADGSGTSYAAGDDFAFTQDATLYAVWDKQPVTAVELSSHIEELTTDDMLKLQAAVNPADASYPLVTWESSDSGIAKVNKNGVVTAIKAGEAVITATADGVSDSCAVTVKQLAEGISVRPQTQTLSVGATVQLKATVAPEDTTEPDVKWASSDTAVATVKNGLVKAVGSGKAMITATVNGFTDMCEVYVSRVMINMRLTVGGVAVLSTALSQDVDGSVAVWKSSDSAVAAVDDEGIVTAVGEGCAVITFTVNDVSHSVGILVDAPDAANGGDGVSVDAG